MAGTRADVGAAQTNVDRTRARVRIALCADVGSTFTKVAAVDLDTGALLATASHRTTVESDVLDGMDAAIAQVTAALGGADVVTRDVCSSAGGGLRLAVVGYEQLVTAEAGRRVALSAGARVVHAAAGPLDPAGMAALRAAAPDVILLVGGTDGGDADVLRHNASRLAGARLVGGSRGRRLPVVVAGNVDVRDEVVATLTARGTPVVGTANVLPRIGHLDAQPARTAIRDAFLRHVIGGKGLSRGRRFASLVRGATPDVVLTAVELLADTIGGDLVVVDIGGATTDVYSVLSPDPSASDKPEVAGTLWRSRSVEGDLGMRWSAPGVIEAATAERLIRADELGWLTEAAEARTNDPSFVSTSDSDQAADVRLATLATTVALRRHARGESSGTGSSASTAVRLPAKDLRRVRLVIGSGGVLRHAHSDAAAAVLGTLLGDHGGGWAPPVRARLATDIDYVLAPAGLLAPHHPRAAAALLSRLRVS